MKIKANGISINYQSKGQGANLVLIHGAGDNLGMWYHQVPVFSRSYRVITYDIRGFGKTENPEGKYSWSLLAEDAYQLMKAIGVKNAYFLGHSMGGRIGLEVALQHPDLVRALVMANSSAGLTPPSPEFMERRRVTLELLDNGDTTRIAEMMTKGAFSRNFKSRNPAEFERYMQVKLQNESAALARVVRLLGIPEAPPDLGKVKCPLLIIAGESDLFMGIEEAKRMREAIVGSRLVVLPTGHAAAIELPDRFNSAVLGFLSEETQG